MNLPELEFPILEEFEKDLSHDFQKSNQQNNSFLQGDSPQIDTHDRDHESVSNSEFDDQNEEDFVSEEINYSNQFDL